LFVELSIKTNRRGSNGLTTFSANCGFIYGGFGEEIKRTSDKQTYKLVQICDDTFIWPHGQETLTEFLNHLNGLHNKIQFTMEKEEGHLPFLDIEIYRKTEGSLGHRVYWKPTHTNLYLHQNSHHHPANKQSVLASLTHRAKALCDQDSLTQELEFLTTVFKDNGYSPQHVR